MGGLTAYLLKRVAAGLLTLVVASVVVFAVLEILPGDPARLMLGFNATEDAVQALRVQMGLDQGLVVRYFQWTGGLLSLEEACQRYTLTVDEFLSWQMSIDQHGLAGLRTTRIQHYRQ